MTVIVHRGDVLEELAKLPADSVQCIVTSPPYWGLRDYGVTGQIGLEPTIDEYIVKMVEVGSALRRVLRPDGVMWWNHGDCYAGSWGNQGRKEGRGTQRQINRAMLQVVDDGRYPSNGCNTGHLTKTPGLKPKDLVGQPWRVAFALQADGWWLRSDIIWAKPNPMPESVTDRPTKAHEYIFLLTKSERYFWDQEAVRETATGRYPGNVARHKHDDGTPLGRTKAGLVDIGPASSRNLRSVWIIPTAPFAEAHFATFPPKLAETCIKAGCQKGGTVLDPFSGAGTTLLVADRLQRHAIGIDLNHTYSDMAERRLSRDRGGLLEAML